MFEDLETFDSRRSQNLSTELIKYCENFVEEWIQKINISIEKSKQSLSVKVYLLLKFYT